MGLIGKLFSRNASGGNWDEIKREGMAYPKHSVSLLMSKTSGDSPGTGWVDKGYEHYAYKRFCPYNFLILVDLTDNIAKSNPDLDMGTVEDFFHDAMRKICVAHLVARLVTDKGMQIEMYLEEQEPVVKYLQNIMTDKKRLVSFTFQVDNDPKWAAVRKLMNS